MGRSRALFFSVGLGISGLLAASLLHATSPAPICTQPSIVIKKREGIVELFCGGARRGEYLATFGKNPVGPKLQQGDEKTPEGRYSVSSRVETPRFHRFLGVSYPNAEDVRRSRALGITNFGNGIGIHGVQKSKAALARVWLRVGHTLGLNRLWGPTDGCIGVSNQDIEALYEAARVGTPILIIP